MYATSSPSEIYHVLTSNDEVTLCGLKLSRAEIDTTLLRAFTLHRVPGKPSNRSLCYQCAKTQRQTAVLMVGV
jgi:hypothetical protein